MSVWAGYVDGRVRVFDCKSRAIRVLVDEGYEFDNTKSRSQSLVFARKGSGHEWYIVEAEVEIWP